MSKNSYINRHGTNKEVVKFHQLQMCPGKRTYVDVKIILPTVIHYITEGTNEQKAEIFKTVKICLIAGLLSSIVFALIIFGIINVLSFIIAGKTILSFLTSFIVGITIVLILC